MKNCTHDSSTLRLSWHGVKFGIDRVLDECYKSRLLPTLVRLRKIFNQPAILDNVVNFPH